MEPASEERFNNSRIVRLARYLPLLTAQVACRARKGFPARRLLSVPKEKRFPSARNVSEGPDRPREELPRRKSGWTKCPAPKTRRTMPAH